MRCPYCGFADTKVTDSRDADEGIRRRRECLNCGQRFTTVERLMSGSLLVAKKDGRREEFSREKLLSGLRKACEKRPLAAGSVEAVADAVEAALRASGAPEVPSVEIGELVMGHLRDLDHIAYIRFASVYRDFADASELREELERLSVHSPNPTDAPTLIPPAELEAMTRGISRFPVRRRRGRPGGGSKSPRARRDGESTARGQR